jgi:hypothetical protein
MDEFRYNTIHVETEKYLMKEKDTEISTDDDDDAEDKNSKKYDEGYYYYGRADTIYNIGIAFGNAMIQLEQHLKNEIIITSPNNIDRNNNNSDILLVRCPDGFQFCGL